MKKELSNWPKKRRLDFKKFAPDFMSGR